MLLLPGPSLIRILFLCRRKLKNFTLKFKSFLFIFEISFFFILNLWRRMPSAHPSGSGDEPRPGASVHLVHVHLVHVGAFVAHASTVLPLTQNKEKFFLAAERRPVRVENISLKIPQKAKIFARAFSAYLIFQEHGHSLVIQSQAQKI